MSKLSKSHLWMAISAIKSNIRKIFFVKRFTMMLLYIYQIFSSLRSHLHFFVHFFFTFMEYFFCGHPISKPCSTTPLGSLQPGKKHQIVGTATLNTIRSFVEMYKIHLDCIPWSSAQRLVEGFCSFEPSSWRWSLVATRWTSPPLHGIFQRGSENSDD